jgi:hypothetical protein
VQSRHVVIALAVWLMAAVLAVMAGALARVPPPAVVLGLALALVAMGTAVSPIRSWIKGADLRLFLVPHFVRFVGIVFLVLVGRGILAEAFVTIGWGDVLAAIGAVGLWALGPPRSRRGRAAWFAWNTLGLADMTLLIVTGMRLALADPGQFVLFRQLPLGLLPTFAVPLIIASHVFVYARLLGERRR